VVKNHFMQVASPGTDSLVVLEIIAVGDILSGNAKNAENILNKLNEKIIKIISGLLNNEVPTFINGNLLC